ncbi:hypothetical protein TRICI_004635 [Trichomonascus ciferrii]|uniref:NmrA-like domain-containing protein n=1 Tax=Trichomonascus ciferrii TaxID=44093 RepID=A0A642V0D1_9ASCO|nr:hypothetical protein TRICI_004635 [Trichomonascus ciferrii]
MAPTILVAGATGNTGRGVVETLPKLLRASKSLSNYRIIALTRSLISPAAQRLAELPGVEVAEQNWVEITPEWLRDHEVVRAFIASHNEPTQFAEESGFYVAALQAGVKYVVRISTTAANVRPDYPAYYPRNHWAIEALLSSPELSELQWSSLQANSFQPFVLASAAEFVKEFRSTGKQPDALKLMAAEDAPVGLIDPEEVGIFAAHLLAQDDVSPHNKARYVVNGPEDITGRQIVALVEQAIGEKVNNVVYKDVSFVDAIYNSNPHHSRNLIMSAKHAQVTAWEGKCTTSTTSKQVLQIAPPKRTPSETFKALLQKIN